MKNPLKPVLYTSFFVFLLLLLAFIGLKLLATYDDDISKKQNLSDIVSQVEIVAGIVWGFIRPFLQLIVILVIVEWSLSKVGLSITGTSKLEWNIQTIIALVIVVSFALAALSGIEGVNYLKDIALVVVGFYFGSQNKLGGKNESNISNQNSN